MAPRLPFPRISCVLLSACFAKRRLDGSLAGQEISKTENRRLSGGGSNRRNDGPVTWKFPRWLLRLVAMQFVMNFITVANCFNPR